MESHSDGAGVFPSICPNAWNDALIAFSQGSATSYVGAAYAMRFGWDAAGVMRAPSQFKAGMSSYDILIPFLNLNPNNRWGDYSITSVDPTDDHTLWTIQDYA